MTLDLKILKQNAKIPTIATLGSAGYDLYACNDEDTVINPNETKLIYTGIAIKIPDNYCGFIYARSGNATKHGIIPANCVGVIDSDYIGEIIVPLYNLGKKQFIVPNGFRIAQLVISSVITPKINIISDFSNTARGTSGFGSTGSY